MEAAHVVTIGENLLSEFLDIVYPRPKVIWLDKSGCFMQQLRVKKIFSDANSSCHACHEHHFRDSNWSMLPLMLLSLFVVCFL